MADLFGRVHEYGDRRLPLPGVLSIIATALAAATNDSTPARIGGAVALAALLLAGPAADPRAADDAGVIGLGLQRRDLQAHAAHLGQALFQPDVAFAHRLAVAGQVLGLAVLDQLPGAPALR